MKRGRKKKKKIYIPSLAHHGIFLVFIAFLALAPLLFDQHSVVQKEIKGLHTTKAQAAVKTSDNPEPTGQPASPSAELGFCLHVPVLVYHHVQPESMAINKGQTALSVDATEFELQMQYLKDNGYTTISAKQLAVALASHAQLPEKSVVVTLDDGYRDAYTYAFPVLKKFNMTGNLMIAAGLVGGEDYLSWEQIEEMSKSGLIYFTNHTWSHAALGVIDEKSIASEVDMAKDAIKAHTGQDIDILTYPYGSFNDTAVAYVKSAGYLAAYTTIPGSTQCDSFLLTLHRDRIGNGNMSDFGF